MYNVMWWKFSGHFLKSEISIFKEVFYEFAIKKGGGLLEVSFLAYLAKELEYISGIKRRYLRKKDKKTKKKLQPFLVGASKNFKGSSW